MLMELDSLNSQWNESKIVVTCTLLIHNDGIQMILIGRWLGSIIVGKP